MELKAQYDQRVGGGFINYNQIICPLSSVITFV